MEKKSQRSIIQNSIKRLANNWHYPTLNSCGSCQDGKSEILRWLAAYVGKATGFWSGNNTSSLIAISNSWIGCDYKGTNDYWMDDDPVSMMKIFWPSGNTGVHAIRTNSEFLSDGGVSVPLAIKCLKIECLMFDRMTVHCSFNLYQSTIMKVI